MEKEKKNIAQPNLDEQKELDALLNHSVTYVEVRGKKWECAPLYNGTLRAMTHVVLNEKEEDKVNVKCAALFRLNNFFKIKLFFWILWRWMYYVKEYRNDELLPYLAECKKKVGLEDYIYSTILVTGMKDTVMSMTREEVEHIQAELIMAQHGASQKSTTE